MAYLEKSSKTDQVTKCYVSSNILKTSEYARPGHFGVLRYVLGDKYIAT